MLYICVYLVIGAQSRTNKLRTNKKRAAAQHGFTSNAQWQWPTNDWFETICKLIALAFSILLLLCVSLCVCMIGGVIISSRAMECTQCVRVRNIWKYFSIGVNVRAPPVSLLMSGISANSFTSPRTRNHVHFGYICISAQMPHHCSPHLHTAISFDIWSKQTVFAGCFFLCSSRAFWLLRSVAWFCFSFAIRVNSIKFLVVRNWACALNNK